MSFLCRLKVGGILKPAVWVAEDTIVFHVEHQVDAHGDGSYVDTWTYWNTRV